MSEQIFKKDFDELFLLWKELQTTAKQNTLEASKKGTGILIEVAAQHPLIDGTLPNEEFTARLDTAIDLYLELRQKTSEPIFFYVPGSLHSFDGIPDLVSLSEAGKDYLVSRGINSDFIFSEGANEKYKGEQGVYNSSDECFVASCIFRDNNFRELHVVCSPVQLHRKALSYIYFGLIPLFHSAPTTETFHNYIDEAFLYIPRLLEDKSGLQDSSSQEANRLREERKPN